MIVKLEDKVVRCHCPTTGRLGEVDLKGLSCLVSSATSENRKTGFTVEAISFQESKKENRSWTGINQTAANRYVEHFLRTGQLSRMAKGDLRREVRLGISRIDFLVGDTYIEVKTPLISLPSTPGIKTVRRSRFDSFDRLIKHMRELSGSLHQGKKAVILMCYLYNAQRFRPPPADKGNSRILDAARMAERSGVQTWQLNLKIDSSGVTVRRYFQNPLFWQDSN